MAPTFSWQYVAGLFDGKGSICTTINKGYPSIRVYIPQSGEEGLRVLTQLADWLVDNGISAYVREAKLCETRKLFKTTLPAYRLYITRQESIIGFLDYILPFLNIKTKQVMRAIGKRDWVWHEIAQGRDFKAHSEELEADNLQHAIRCVI